MADPVVSSARQRPDLFRRGHELTEGIWTVYNTHWAALSRHWSDLHTVFPEYQFTVHDADSGEVLAQGFSVPCRWDGTVDGLPDGIDAAFQAAFEPAD